MKRLFGTDGIRGIVNDELTVDLAMRLGNSVARLYNGKYKNASYCWIQEVPVRCSRQQLTTRAILPD